MVNYLKLFLFFLISPWVLHSQEKEETLRELVVRSANNDLIASLGILHHFRTKDTSKPEAEYFWSLVCRRQRDKKVDDQALEEIENRVLTLNFEYIADKDSQKKLRKLLLEERYSTISNFFLITGSTEQALFWRAVGNKRKRVQDRNDRYPIPISRDALELLESSIFESYAGYEIELEF